MKHSKLTLMLSLLLFIGGSFSFLNAQPVTLPPSGGNQKSAVSQQIGIAKVTIKYSSPDVAGREGQIWGQLVPYGLTNLGFGPATAAPWRAGANENTTIHFSHDVKVQGKNIKAGSYGLHMIVEEEGPWTLIFSNNTSSWGSFYYQEDEDVLRVEADPKENAFTEWLTYEFTDRSPAAATVEMQWENVSVPFKIEVENMEELYIAQMRDELRSTAGFSWQGFNSAANYCLTNKTHLEEGLAWIEQGITAPFIGQANFQTLQTKSLLLYALDRKEEGQETMLAALDHAALPTQKYQLGSALIQQNLNEEAYTFFKKVYEQDPDAWISHAGLAAGLRVTGETQKALKHYKKALADAPDQWKPSLEARIKLVEESLSASN